MSQPAFSPELIRFIQTSLPSYDAAVFLVCLSRDPGRDWSLDDLAAGLGLDLALVTTHVEQFLKSGVLERSGEDSFRLATEARTVAEELRVAYDRRPVTLIRAIDSASRAKIQSFADSFRLKRDRE